MEPKNVEVQDDSGNVDFRDLNLIKEIHSGQEILRIVPADPGEEGIDIMGRSIAVSSVKKQNSDQVKMFAMMKKATLFMPWLTAM